MSFMAGFGQGFSTSFNAARERVEDRKKDTFRLMFDEFKNNRKIQEEYKKEDAKRVRQAKALAEGLDVPEGAWMKAYEWLQAGLDEKTVAQRLQSGSFSASEMPAGQTSRPALDQTQEALSADSTPQTSQTPGAPSPTSSKEGQVLQESNSIFWKDGDFGADAVKRIADTIGMSPEEVRKILASTTPEGGSVDTSGAPKWKAPAKEQPDVPALDQALFNLENARTPQEQELAQAQVDAIQGAELFKARAKAKAEGLSMDGAVVKFRKPDGTVGITQGRLSEDNVMRDWMTGEELEAFVPMSEEEMKSMDRVAATGQSSNAVVYLAQVAAIPTAYRTAEEMAILANNQPALQMPITSNIVESTQAFIAELLTAGRILMNPEDKISQYANGVAPTPEDFQSLQTVEQQLVEILGQNPNDIAAAKTLWDTRAAMMAYHLGIMAGQEGRALQEPERKLFMQLAQGGITPQKFMENMGGIIASYRGQVERAGENLQKWNSEVARHEALWGDGSLPFKVAPSVQEILEGTQDPLVRAGVERFSQYDPVNSKFFTGGEGSAPKTKALPEEGSSNKLTVGQVVNGYRYKGGDPKDQNSWEPE